MTIQVLDAPAPEAPPVAIGRVKRVCLVIGQLELGGAEQQVALLAAGLERRGVRTTVALLGRSGPREAILAEAGVPVLHLNNRRPRWALRWPHALKAVRFWRIVKALRPDVVHAFLIQSHLIAVPVARLAGVPLVVASRRNLADVRRNAGPGYAALERVAARRSDLVIANAHAVSDDAVRSDRISRDRIRVIYNGLPESAFAPSPARPIETPWPVVLCVANFHAYKGHAYLLDAVARLAERGRRVTLVLAGDGRERASVQARADALHLDVRLLGAQTEIGSLLARADVVAMPSLTEGMSNAIMEAMAAGRPVVATRVGGSPELVNGRGLLVEPGDAAGLADALETVLRNPQAARDMAARARRWARTHLGVDRMVDEHLALYAQHLDAH